MKKESIYKFLYVVSLLLMAGFCIGLGADWYGYNTTLNSAPFWLWVAIRAVEFILPALVVFIAARIVRKKYCK